MMVVGDLDGEPYLPCPYDLLVSLSESRPVIEAFLERLGDMFRHTTNVGNVLGRALTFSYKLLVRGLHEF
jgi:protein transport protein SEC24